MTEPSDDSGPPAAPAPAGAAEDLERLRALLVAPERAAIARLGEALKQGAVRPETVARVLPAAVAACSARNEALAHALAPTIEAGFHYSVRKDPQPVVDAIFPVIGPAIRRAVRESLARMMESINKLLEQGFSPRAWGWRLEAWRKGRPFAEVALSHTLAFRVEQVFLISASTGLLLQHAVNDHVLARDPELVSGMLTAIQDFVRESFASEAGAGLESMRVGDLLVWVERGPHAHLALAIRGTPPAALRIQAAEVLEQVHRRHANALVRHRGDGAQLEEAAPLLAGCLVEEAQTRTEGRRPVAALVAVALLALALATWVFWPKARDDRWERFLARLRSEPGVTVTWATEEGGGWVAHGLRDSLAIEPAELLRSFDLPPSEVALVFHAYEGTYGPFVLTRARRALQPPHTVSLALQGRILIGTGAATHEWIARAKQVGGLVGGVDGIDTSAILDLDRAMLDRARARLEGLHVACVPSRVEPTPGQEHALQAAAVEAEALVHAAEALGLRARIQVLGRTEPGAGPAEESSALALERARAIQRRLADEGVTAIAVALREAPQEAAPDVGFHVTYEPRIALAEDAR